MSSFLPIACAVCMAACCFSLRAETIEVHTVLASEPGKPGAIPGELTKFKAPLAACAFNKFANGGQQSVILTAASPKAVVPVGGFSLELTRQGASKVDVTVKEIVKNNVSKTVFGPIAYMFAKEKTKQLELPTSKGAYIIFLTLDKE